MVGIIVDARTKEHVADGPRRAALAEPPIDPAHATDAGILPLVVVAAAVLALAAAVLGVVTRRRV